MPEPTEEETSTMAHEDKAENKYDEATGKLKETAGKATGDEQMEAEGRAEKDKAQLKDRVQDTVEKVKDVFKR
ncbi:MAG: CsbD family protein [Pseudonocardiaceae bacterium]